MNINKLIKIIDSENLAIVPTDTVYGIIADATNEKAIQKVYEAKNRESKKPLIVMVSSIDMLLDYTKEINDNEKSIINMFWPGKLTILLKKNDKLSNLINNNGEYVGFRLPDSAELIELMNKLNKPLISTSANIAGQKTITNVEMLDKKLLNHISYVYDGGYREDVPSTIIQMCDDKVKFLRKGEIAQAIESSFECM